MKTDNLKNFILLCFILVILAASCSVNVRAAAGAQVPYLDGCVNGVCTVYWPGVSGYDSGYLEVFNVCTQERGALYLLWQAEHPLDMGRYTTDVRQLFTMGSCTYIVTEGHLGYLEIYLPSWAQVFSFQMWQSWLAVMR